MMRKQRMKNRGNGLFLGMSFALVLVIAACITLTVKGSEKQSAGGYDEAYYDSMEEAYQEEVAEVLAQYGVGTSGINLTKITEADGTRAYTLAIYNRNFDRMDEAKMGSLEKSLNEVVFPEEACEIVISLRGV